MDPIIFITPDNPEDLDLVREVVLERYVEEGDFSGTTTEVVVMPSSVVLADPAARRRAETIARYGRTARVQLRLVDSVPWATLDYFGGSALLRSAAGSGGGSSVVIAPAGEQELQEYLAARR